MKTGTGRKVCASQAGFSLIEILVAVVVLFIIVFAFTSMLTDGMFGIVRAGERSTNIFASQEKLERKLSMGTTINTPLTITLPDKTTITIPGEIVEFPQGNVNISVFIPRQ